MTGDIFGCRHWRRRCYWHLVGRRQGCYSTSYQEGPTTVIQPQMSPGHRCATTGLDHGAGLGAFPAGMAALRRGASLSHVFGTRASEALQTPALWSEPEPERRLAPLGQTQTRAASQRGHPSSSPPGTQIEGVGRTPPGLENLAASPARDPYHLCQRKEGFSSRRGVLSPPSPPCTAEGAPAAPSSRTPRAPRVWVGNFSIPSPGGGGASRRRPLPRPTVSQRLPGRSRGWGLRGGRVRLCAHA